MDNYYIVGFIALIIATLLFVMYINVINMDLVMDEHEEKEDQDRSVEYVVVDRSQGQKQILGKDGHGIRKQIPGNAGQQKKILGSVSADGFLDYMNDLTIKSKGLRTGAENVSNLV